MSDGFGPGGGDFDEDVVLEDFLGFVVDLVGYEEEGEVEGVGCGEVGG